MQINQDKLMIIECMDVYRNWLRPLRWNNRWLDCTLRWWRCNVRCYIRTGPGRKPRPQLKYQSNQSINNPLLCILLFTWIPIKLNMKYTINTKSSIIWNIIIRAIFFFDHLNPKFIHFPNFYQNLGLKGQKLSKFVPMDFLSK